MSDRSAYMGRYYSEHRDARRKYNAAYYQAHRAAIRARQQAARAEAAKVIPMVRVRPHAAVPLPQSAS
jgi:hypothetical protein